MADDPRPSTRHPRPASRVLVRRVCGLGDLILTLPFLRALRNLHASSQIHVLAHREHADLLAAAGSVDRGYPEEGSGWHHLYGATSFPVGQSLRPDPFEYDAVYLFVGNPAGSALARALRDLLGERLHAIPARPPANHTGHAALYSLGFLPLRGGHETCEGPRLARIEVGSEHPEALKVQHCAAQGLRPVLFHPGSGSTNKNWPTDRFAEIIRRSMARFPGLHPFLLGGPSDHATLASLIRFLGRVWESRALRPSGIADLAALLSGIELFVGNDSGVAHLSAALGTPTIPIFGPSDPLQWAPLGPRVRVLQRENRCAPCHLSAEGPCDQAVCERFPSVEVVWEALSLEIGRIMHT
jgi:ADP-heptose:LPS heptosyltransferase